MKGIVIYDTSHKNTLKIAETISGTLKEAGIEVDTFYVKDVKGLKPESYDFLVLGSPTRWGTMSFAVKGLLGKFNDNDWINKPFAVFDTELVENIERNEGSAAEKMAEILKQKQMNQLLPVFKAVVVGMKGPLKEGEIERTKEYAKEIVESINRVHIA